jgi:hypothetical protein
MTCPSETEVHSGGEAIWPSYKQQKQLYCTRQSSDTGRLLKALCIEIRVPQRQRQMQGDFSVIILTVLFLAHLSRSCLLNFSHV